MTVGVYMYDTVVLLGRESLVVDSERWSLVVVSYRVTVVVTFS